MIYELYYVIIRRVLCHIKIDTFDAVFQKFEAKYNLKSGVAGVNILVINQFYTLFVTDFFANGFVFFDFVRFRKSVCRFAVNAVFFTVSFIPLV